MLLNLASTGRLADNIVHFARTLQRAGLPVGLSQTQDALSAVALTGVEDRERLRAALRCTLVRRREHLLLFEQAFELYWQNPQLASKMMAAMLPTVHGRGGPPSEPPRHGHRTEQAFLPAPDAGRPGAPLRPLEDEIVLDAAMTASSAERLLTPDFDTMTAQESAEVRRALLSLRPALPQRLTRRSRSAAQGERLDLRRTLRATLQARAQGGKAQLWWRQRRTLARPLVVLADISGSMERYTRMLVFFLKALVSAGARVEAFLFGTRLTRVTPALQADPDDMLADLTSRVRDWQGGTRLTRCLTDFNRLWSRRVLGQGAHVLLITDGLEGGDDFDLEGLDAAMARLHRSGGQLLWLNPLLRFQGFEARSQSLRVMLRHVDAFLPAHNLESLHQLVDVFRSLDDARAMAGRLRSARSRLSAGRPQA